MKVVFIHPDLGIGGAERLVVDAATAVKAVGHEVHIVTNHHDPGHCFQETRDGTLNVTVVGERLPRNIFGKFAALCAYIRMIYAAYFLVYRSGLDPDIIFCDQISACIPVLKWSGVKVVFYCHFPDQLLTRRENIFKKMYRAPLDWFEEYTTGKADVILVNSNFTAGIFRKTFPSLHKLPIQVLYPSLNFQSFDKPLQGDLSEMKLKKGVKTVFLSINRYERKKNLELALYAMEKLITSLEQEKETVHLIIAGGYDPRVPENITYHAELQERSKELGLASFITFLKSPADNIKQLLLHSCTALIYTPENEHFGIVPLEAMYMYRPVIAANSGGPMETIVDGETGFLREPNSGAFASAMMKIANDHSMAREMGKDANLRVKQLFSYENFKRHLADLIENNSPNDKSK